MRYFTLPSRVFGAALLRRRDTTIHFLKITKRISIVWDFPDTPEKTSAEQ